MTMTTTGAEISVQQSGPTPAAEKSARRSIKKKRTGVAGFDDLAEGGLPAAGVTAIIGDPGSGKTVFALQTLVNGFRQRGERGIFVLFEEPEAQIRHNFSSFDWGFAQIRDDEIRLVDARLPLDTVRSGVFDLSGLLAVLTTLISGSGARNVGFDGIDVLLNALNNEALERQEIVRLGRWVRDTGVTAVLTVKSHKAGERDQLRADFLQYMTDCVVVFDGVLTPTAFTRTIRVSKYRGSGFAANPVPFVIGESGMEVVGFANGRPVAPMFADRVSTGVPRLDDKLEGGYLRGSCTLVSGAPGTSKTSLGASFLAAACSRGHRSLLISFDESGAQIVANMKSIGVDLERHLQSGLLTMESLLSVAKGPEEHYVTIRRLLDQARPEFLVIDPLSALLATKLPFAEMICQRILDQIKSSGITALCTSLVDNLGSVDELSASHVSTVADTWLHVSYHAHGGERNRALTIVKSRGTAHSSQVCELILGSDGIEIADVYAAEGDVLMGSARRQKMARDRRDRQQQDLEDQRMRFEIDKNIAELRLLAQRASQELEWKEREAHLHDVIQKTIGEAEQKDAHERLTSRTDRPGRAALQAGQ